RAAARRGPRPGGQWTARPAARSGGRGWRSQSWVLWTSRFSAGDADLVRVVRGARLEQQNARRGVLGEPQREDTTGATGTDDDIVVHSHLMTAERVRRGQP